MDFKKSFFRYFQFWPWIMGSLLLCVGGAFYFLKTMPPSYQTSALISIDKNRQEDTKINTFSKNEVEKKEVNLSDEKQLINSYGFLAKVVEDLHLNITYLEKGTLLDTSVEEIPFIVNSTVSNKLLSKKKYDIKIVSNGLLVSDPAINKSYLIHGNGGPQSFYGLPFTIQLTPLGKKNSNQFLSKEYVVNFESITQAVKNLKSALIVETLEDQNTNMMLNHKGANPELSQKILNEIIVSLDNNIIEGKQKLYNNTVNYLNQRIAVFSKEKDSIESIKEKYLQNNDILVMDNYIADKTNEKNSKQESSLLNKRQIELTKYAINDIKKTGNTSVLGTGYNLEAPTVNQLLSNYNTSVLESDLLLQRAQKNNPAYLNIVQQLKTQKQAVLNTLQGYLEYLNQNNIANRSEQNRANSEAKSIPTKDKVLGNINNKIDLKGVTYLTLLQKKEEATLNIAVLESNLKTLNAPETDYSTVFPQPKSFMLGAIIFGLLLPLGTIYFKLQLDTKIHNEEDIQNVLSHVPFLGIIPKINAKDNLDHTANSRSTIAEVTRILFSNISYLLPKKVDNKGNVLLFCSANQGEGKSFCAFNNAVTISNLNKKVLLIGADMRNPQLHNYFKISKNISGLSNFLANKSEDWKEFVVKDASYSENLDTLFSGEIPPNPAQLLTNYNFEALIEEAKSMYDFIIIDSAPVQMVSDTLIFGNLADVTIFVTRYDFTEKNTLIQLNNMIKKNQLNNVGIIINDVSRKSAYGYNYGSNYNYNYNEMSLKKPWLRRFVS
ncbi:capsular exopolysaccharide synthesis family protein [Flavobacterium sp. PL11]|jgi:capsular exopolysaccharide synthesis family protein|uniref:exopolysaccharide transport family protein n=1 Tax=Flavobacterium sp. PL11 TaxID=3071717 RepID=UPI002DFB542F|nr:capsular exopolysaccharide synthesis family protein [Flavobacterium sp. PL11]